MATFGHFLVLFGVTFSGVFLGCRVFAYEISFSRKVAAALCFAGLNAIPLSLPVIELLVPAGGLYMCLVDQFYNRAKVTKVFLLTVAFAITATIVLYAIAR